MIMRYLAMLFLLAVQACQVQSKSNDEENRNVESFNAIEVSSGIDLYLSEGSSESVRLTVENGDLSDVITEVHDGQLRIGFERNMGWKGWNFDRRIKAFVTFRELEALGASGGSDVFGEEPLSFEDLRISVSGGSDVKMELNADNIRANASGGSDLVLSGETRNFEGTVSGGSDIRAKDLRIQNAKINASGGSDAFIWVEGSCDCHSSGGSDIHYTR
jgi:hypothetical protein